MCGIAGFVGDDGYDSASESRLREMLHAITHRGPDDEGRWVERGVAIGMRRLSIIDVAGGKQPIANEDGSIRVVFNGEIYNHHELRRALERQGHTFATHSDTETLVHLYEQYGPEMVGHLRGMFAFAIWDAPRQRLFAARDRIGIKPLYLWARPGSLAFASELRCFLRAPDFPRELSPSAVAEFLSLGYVSERSCIFSAASKLPPGHWLTWDRADGVRTTPYWSPVRAEQGARSDADLTAELQERLKSAVSSHLESEVPLGAFLSGGVDSSTVVALMARTMDRPVDTFSIGFEEHAYNEAPHAASVARDLRTNHTELIVRPDVDALVDDLVSAFDEPFGDASAIPTFLVARLARQHVTVALSGDGGDELFAGYTRYREALEQPFVAPAPIRALARGAVSLLPQSARGRNYLLNLTRASRGRYASMVAQPLSAREGGIARAEISRLLPAFDRLLDSWFDAAAFRDFATQMTMVDLQTYLPGDILTKVDRTSMAVSLEARVPLLDHPLIEFAAALPIGAKMRGSEGKWLLRNAITDLVPPQVLVKQKQGFGVPLDHWFRGPLSGRLRSLTANGSPIHEYVAVEGVQRLVREHTSGRRNHMGRLWRLVALQGWLAALSRGDLARPTSLMRVLPGIGREDTRYT